MEAAACNVAIASVRIPPPKSDGRGLSGHLHATSTIFAEPAERQPMIPPTRATAPNVAG